MIYVLFKNGLPVHATSESPYTGTPDMKKFDGVEYDEAKSCRDFKSHEEVVGIAAALTALTGTTYLGFDNGEHTSHRFGVLVAPKVGDDVSYCFNGDCYPCGKIVKITKGWRITTSTGRAFNRRHKISSTWMMVGGTWFLVSGTRNDRNPSF